MDISKINRTLETLGRRVLPSLPRLRVDVCGVLGEHIPRPSRKMGLRVDGTHGNSKGTREISVVFVCTIEAALWFSAVHRGRPLVTNRTLETVGRRIQEYVSTCMVSIVNI